MVRLWLDDVRPAPEGWLWVKTVEDAQLHLAQGTVAMASLDHDLGACPACLNGRSAEDWLYESGFTEMPHCTHFGTGYTLVCWMAETGFWPTCKPQVHSMNPVGSARMRQMIDRYFGTRQGVPYTDR